MKYILMDGTSRVIRDPQTIDFMGAEAVCGANFHCTAQTHLIQASLIKRSYEVEQDLKYGGLKKKR